jgi:hypothetical protein
VGTVEESWDDVIASLSGAYGLTAEGSTLLEHSELIVELSDAEAGADEHRYRLRIYGAAWRLESGDGVLAGSADESDDLAAQVARLDGQTVTSITVEPRSLSARFVFAGGLSLITFSVYSHGFEHWALRRPDGTELIAGPGSAWSFRAAEAAAS